MYTCIDANMHVYVYAHVCAHSVDSMVDLKI